MRAAWRWRSAPALLALAVLPLGCEPKAAPETVPGVGVAEEVVPEEPPVEAAAPPPGCAGGVVREDGSVETGYGFVPSATFGEYVQELSAAELSSRRLAKVCLCWLKTRGGRDVDFEVVFYAAAGGRPADEPYAVVAASAQGLPESVEAAGRFYEVDVSEVTVPAGVSYVGARWDPSAARFLFVCTDRSEATDPVPVFFREDRAPRWQSVFTARDPIFQGHRAILVRSEAAPPP